MIYLPDVIQINKSVAKLASLRIPPAGAFANVFQTWPWKQMEADEGQRIPIPVVKSLQMKKWLISHVNLTKLLTKEVSVRRACHFANERRAISGDIIAPLQPRSKERRLNFGRCWNPGSFEPGLSSGGQSILVKKGREQGGWMAPPSDGQGYSSTHPVSDETAS